jgi:hypothetical protein
MDRLDNAMRIIADQMPNLTPEELTQLSESLRKAVKDVKKRQREVERKPKTSSQSGPMAVTQQLDHSYQTIEEQIGKGFSVSKRTTDVLVHDVADTHRAPIAQARKALASLYLASAHDLCDEYGKASKKIRMTRSETLRASTRGDTRFRGTVKYFIEVNGLGHIAHITHGLSKVGYKLLLLLRCPGSDSDLLGLLLFCVGPLSHVSNGQLGELQKLLEKYRGIADENRGWCRRWLASYQGIVLVEFCLIQSANKNVVAETRPNLWTLIPSAYQLHQPALPSILYPAHTVADYSFDKGVQDFDRLSGRWRADAGCRGWPTDPDHTPRPMLEAAPAEWLFGDGKRFSPTNLEFVMSQTVVDGEVARRIPGSSSPHHQIAVQPPVHQDRYLGLDSFRPHKKSRC